MKPKVTCKPLTEAEYMQEMKDRPSCVLRGEPDFRPFMAKLDESIYKNWKTDLKGSRTVVLFFSISVEGKISNIRLSK